MQIFSMNNNTEVESNGFPDIAISFLDANAVDDNLPSFHDSSREYMKVFGASPKDLPQYLGDKGILCNISDSRSIVLPFERVNDDYCDCQDGRDEPGIFPLPSNADITHCLGYGLCIMPFRFPRNTTQV
jgi:hypothetical protein